MEEAKSVRAGDRWVVEGKGGGSGPLDQTMTNGPTELEVTADTGEQEWGTEVTRGHPSR